MAAITEWNERRAATEVVKEARVTHAYCIMNPDGGSSVSGVVRMVQHGTGKTKITARIEGLTPGLHGFHIHQYGNLSEGCKSAGPHFNPFGLTHGAPDADERHVGDLGNVTAGADGVAVYELEDHLVQLTGENSVIGRSFVVHAGVDDLGLGGHELSKTTGNAGGRLACGTIGLSAPF